MREYNLTIQEKVIQEKVVVGIAAEVIEYLKEYPHNYVECTVNKMILHEESPFSDKPIIDIVRRLLFPLLFNGEEVDLLGFISRMFEMRKELINSVIKLVREKMPEYDVFPIDNPDEGFYEYFPKIVEYLSLLWDLFLNP